MHQNYYIYLSKTSHVLNWIFYMKNVFFVHNFKYEFFGISFELIVLIISAVIDFIDIPV